MRHRKTACFEALVLEPHFAQSCGRFLLLYCILGWRTSLQRLKIAVHVLVKSWFAAPLWDSSSIFDVLLWVTFPWFLGFRCECAGFGEV